MTTANPNPQSIIPEEIMIAKQSVPKANRPKWHKKAFNRMQELDIQLFLGVLLLLSLFIADSWVLGNAADFTNDIMYGILMATFVIFTIETIALSVIQEGYFNSFFFWMDVVGTLSLILDIGWIADTFIPSGSVANTGSIVRATRAAKLGARYGRLLRLLRLMRFARFLPCFGDGPEEYEPTLASIRKVSNELSAVLSLRVAALVMLLVIVVPFLSYTIKDYSANSWVDNIKLIAQNENVTMYELESISSHFKSFYKYKDDKLRYISIQSPYVSEGVANRYSTTSPLRDSNILEIRSTFEVSEQTLRDSGNPYAISYADAGKTKFRVHAKMDQTIRYQFNAMFNILVIVLVIIVLFTFTASFSKAVTTLVVQPLEGMMTTLRNSAMVMLKSMKAVEGNAKEEKKAKGEIPEEEEDDEDDEDDEELESAMLEKMVEKLARIVQHVLPGKNEIAVDANIDKTTANWLNQSFDTGGNTTRNTAAVGNAASRVDASGEYQRIRDLDESQQIVSKELLNSWDFDVLEYTYDQLYVIMSYQFSLLNLLNTFKVPPAVFTAFLHEIQGRYIENSYHKFSHGVDVCHTVFRLLTVSSLHLGALSELEIFSTLVGALAHDVGHPGVNNVYLVKAKHELALLHNDRSPLENMHCVVLYEVLMKEPTNIFKELSASEWKESRKVILTIILGTDMSHHFEQISKTQLFGEVNGEDTNSYCAGTTDTIQCFDEDKNRLFIMELLLHCSDISNPFKPYAICAKWADLVVEEFCLQGDREKQEGLELSPMCDRTAIVLYNMQMGFIEFVVAPLIIALINIFPSLHEIGSNMTNNFVSWGELNKIGIMDDEKITDKADATKKLEERLQKFREKLSFVDKYKEQKGRKLEL